MKVLIVDNGGKIPAINYGGTERVIWSLAKELHKQNHEIVFLVPKGSHCNFAKVLEYNPQKHLNDQIPDDIDLVHVHFMLTEPIKKPYLITIHGNYDTNDKFDKQSVFLSKNHASRHNSKAYVYNGLDWDDYPKIDLSKKRSHYHFLGKTSWKVKNAHGAYSIAEKTNNKLLVLGGKKWTESNIKKSLRYLFNPKIKFMGMVDNDTKSKIANASKGLIFPVRWHEPFGLAVIESLYCGSPVYSTSYGSLEELVKEEVGFTSNSKNAIIKAIKNSNFSPKTCHEYAIDCFNAKVMTNNYIKLYEKVLNGESINKENPSLINQEDKTLLPFT